MQVLEQSTSETGGVKFGSVAFNGLGAYSRLRHEAGVHRVQRVPLTEKEGRIHTSTASVVVLPEANEVGHPASGEAGRGASVAGKDGKGGMKGNPWAPISLPCQMEPRV
jgi:protein subunit release factor A